MNAHLMLYISDHPPFHRHPPRFFTSFTITTRIFFSFAPDGSKDWSPFKTLFNASSPLILSVSYYRHTEDMIVTPFAQVSLRKPLQLTTGDQAYLPDGRS